jgi:hypothetical protein
MRDTEVTKGFDEFRRIVRPDVFQPAFGSCEVDETSVSIVGRLRDQRVSINPSGSSVIDHKQVLHAPNTDRFLIVEYDMVSGYRIAECNGDRATDTSFDAALDAGHLSSLAIRAVGILGSVRAQVLNRDTLQAKIPVRRHGLILTSLVRPTVPIHRITLHRTT